MHNRPEKNEDLGAGPQKFDRLFTVLALPELPVNDNFSASYIRHGYITIDNDMTTVELLDIDGSHTISVIRAAQDGSIQAREEVRVTQEMFDSFWYDESCLQIEKHRFSLLYQDSVIVTDIYEGDLAGLATAEVEFLSAEAARQFSPPAWLGDELTRDL